MRAALLLAAAACAAESGGSFPVGLLGPVSPRVAVEAGRLGLDVVDVLPAGAVSASAASPSATDGEVAADWAALRLAAAVAIADGARGFFLRLPAAPSGRDLLDYPEEWQAPARALGELQAIRPVLERGVGATVPFAAPPGVRARAWRRRGRLYVLLVNGAATEAPFDGAELEPFRALFAPRSDPRQALYRCGVRFCLPAGSALWLEGRLL